MYLFHRMRSLLWVVAFVIVCGAVTTLLKTVDRTIFRSGRGTQANLPAALPSPDEGSPRVNSGQLAIKPPAMSAADQHWEATKLLSEAEVAQRDAIRLIDVWNTEIEPLRNDESGDVVAANKDLVQKLTYVFSKQRTEERAAKLTVKMVFPIVLCFLPVFMIVTLVPALITVFDAI